MTRTRGHSAREAFGVCVMLSPAASGRMRAPRPLGSKVVLTPTPPASELTPILSDLYHILSGETQIALLTWVVTRFGSALDPVAVAPPSVSHSVPRRLEIGHAAGSSV